MPDPLPSSPHGRTRRLAFDAAPALRQAEKTIWEVGDVIAGKYEVTGIAGRGGMGIVYKVHHREWNLDMAVKTPLPALVHDPASKARFIREAQTWVDLGMHPNLVQCWYVRELGGLPRLFVDFMQGGSLKDWIDQGRVQPGDWATIIDLIVQACDGLGYGHERGVVHRDVKPANMLMTLEGRLCMTDFGLVKLQGVDEIVSAKDNVDQLAGAGTEALTLTGSNMGTPQYGAPEQWGEARHVDARADVYALGISLYELCCGRRPFDEREQREPAHVIVGRQLMAAPPDPRQFRPDLPETLAAIILGCLAKKPENRPASMRALREALSHAFTQISGQAYGREMPQVAEARASMLNNRAVSMWDLGQPEEAEAAWREALSQDAHHAESLYNHALLDWRRGLTNDGDIAQRLSEIKGAGQRVCLYLGYIKLEAAAAAEAEAHFADALQDPVLAQDGTIWRALGHAQMAQEKFEQAQAAYAAALDRIPNDAIARDCAALAVARTRRRANRLAFPNLRRAGVIEGRTGSVRALIVTPNAQAFSDGLLGAVSRWDLAARKVLWNFNGHQRPVLCLALTGDGRLALSGSDEAAIRAWKLENNQPLEDFYGKGHVGAVQALAVTPDNNYVVSGGGDKSLRVWELGKGYLTKTLWGHEKGINVVLLTAEGMAISGSEDQSVRLWDLASGSCLATIHDELTPVKALALLPNGPVTKAPTLAAGWAVQAPLPAAACLMVAGADGMLQLRQLPSGKLLRRFAGHRGTVQCVAFTPDGRFALSGGDDRTLRLWEVASGRCLRTLSAFQGSVLALALTHDGRLAVTGSAENEGHPLQLWTLELEAWQASGPSAELFKAPLIVNRVENQLQAQEASHRFQKALEAAHSAWHSHDARRACQHLHAARAVPGYERDPRVLALNTQLSSALIRKALAAGYLRLTLEARHPRALSALALTPDCKLALSAGNEDKAICLWQLASGGFLGRLAEHKLWPQALTVSAGGGLAASGGCDYLVGLWELPAGKNVALLDGHKGEVNAVAFRPDTRMLFSAANDGSVRAWDLGTLKCVRVFEEGGRVPVRALCALPDNRTVAAAHEDGAIRLWSLLSGQCTKVLSGHSGAVKALRCSPDAELLLSAGEDKTLRVWSLNAGSTRVLKESGARFEALVLSPDGRFAFSAGLEGSGTPLRVWDVAAGKQVSCFGKHPKGITALALSADGCVLLSGGEDQVVRVWDLEWELDSERPASAVLTQTRSQTARLTRGTQRPAPEKRKPDNPFKF